MNLQNVKPEKRAGGNDSDIPYPYRLCGDRGSRGRIRRVSLTRPTRQIADPHYQLCLLGHSHTSLMDDHNPLLPSLDGTPAAISGSYSLCFASNWTTKPFSILVSFSRGPVKAGSFPS
jgi:hypothetical protein